MRQKAGSKKILKILLSLIIISGLSYWWYHKNIYTSIDESDNSEISFTIKKGTVVKEIAQNLENAELINSDFSFYLYTKFHSRGEDIIAGRFLLNKTMNTPEILANITDPAKAEFIITIQEGLTVKDIDTKLVELELIESGEFLKEVRDFNGWEYYSFLDQIALEAIELPVEGYLYPDTYFLDPGTFEPHDLIYLAMDNFEQKWEQLEANLADRTMHEIITMASIIENEVREKEDREIVSGILWKRLDNDWTLGADATLLYISEDRKLTAEELEMDSPYNTRKNKGLPPGPIGNPSLESIEAASNPKESEYWFYLTSLDTGEVIYAKTNEEHNANKAEYLN